MLENKKPKWDKPKLIVLVRGDRQEVVLYDCKGYDRTADPGVVQDNCRRDVPATCFVCVMQQPS